MMQREFEFVSNIKGLRIYRGIDDKGWECFKVTNAEGDTHLQMRGLDLLMCRIDEAIEMGRRIGL